MSGQIIENLFVYFWSNLKTSFYLTVFLVLLTRIPSGQGAIIEIKQVQVLNKATKQDNNRGDAAKAVDGDLSSIAHFTKPFSTGPQLIIYDFGENEVLVNRVRVAKIGDTTSGGSGSLDNMDLKILFSRDKGPVTNRSYNNVSGLKNGFLGAELIKA